MILLSGRSLAAGLLALVSPMTAAQPDHGDVLERFANIKAVRDDMYRKLPSISPPSFTEVNGRNGDIWCDPAGETQCDHSICNGRILPSPFPTPGPACLAVGAQMFCTCTPSNQTPNFCPDPDKIPCDDNCAPNNNVCSQKWANCPCDR